MGVTGEADFPGLLSQIPQVSETARYICISYSYYKGVPAPLTNGGLNEFGVAVRDTWSPSCQALIDLTHDEQTGPNYSDLARIVLERAKTAREGVEIIGDLIATYGHSSYGGNSHLIADADEAWVIIECAGNQGIWAAERLGADSIRASRPGYIEMIPIDQTDHSDFLYSPNLVSFAEDRGWYKGGNIFNFNLIYGDGKGRWPGVVWIEDEMRKRAERTEKIGLKDIFWAVRTSNLTGDSAGYGQIVPLQNQAFSELRYLWHSPIGALVAPFVPVYLGVYQVPEEFRRHRYLTVGESSKFMDTRSFDQDEFDAISTVSQGIESTRAACQVFKRLMYLILQNQLPFLEEVTVVTATANPQINAAGL